MDTLNPTAAAISLALLTLCILFFLFKWIDAQQAKLGLELQIIHLMERWNIKAQTTLKCNVDNNKAMEAAANVYVECTDDLEKLVK